MDKVEGKIIVGPWEGPLPRSGTWINKERMTVSPLWLPKNTYFRVGCIFCGSFGFPGLSFANKFSKVQRVPLQVVSGTPQVWVTLAHLSLDESVWRAEVLTEPELRTMFIYICTQ